MDNEPLADEDRRYLGYEPYGDEERKMTMRPVQEPVQEFPSFEEYVRRVMPDAFSDPSESRPQSPFSDYALEEPQAAGNSPPALSLPGQTGGQSSEQQQKDHCQTSSLPEPVATSYQPNMHPATALALPQLRTASPESSPPFSSTSLFRPLAQTLQRHFNPAPTSSSSEPAATPALSQLRAGSPQSGSSLNYTSLFRPLARTLQSGSSLDSTTLFRPLDRTLQSSLQTPSASLPLVPQRPSATLPRPTAIQAPTLSPSTTPHPKCLQCFQRGSRCDSPLGRPRCSRCVKEIRTCVPYDGTPKRIRIRKPRPDRRSSRMSGST